MLKNKVFWYTSGVVLFLVTLIQILRPASLGSRELVILAHGLGNSVNTMRVMQAHLEQEGFEVCSIDYETIGRSVNQVLDDSEYAINQCIERAAKTHFVGYSLGGLVVKHYLSQSPELTKHAQLGQVLMIGTPNLGSEVANRMTASTMNFDGGIGKALMTGKQTLGQQIPALTIAVGVIAGHKRSGATAQYFSSENDGVVSVKSAQFNPMKAFISLPVGHSQLRTNPQVLEQISHFLQQGHFKKTHHR